MSDNNSELLLIDESTAGQIFDYQMKTGLVDWFLKIFHRLIFSTPKVELLYFQTRKRRLNNKPLQRTKRWLNEQIFWL